MWQHAELLNLIDDLGDAADTIETRTEQARDVTKGAIKDTAIDLAAVDSGELRSSIEETEDGVEASALHSVFVEFGTWKDAPQPFMGPAADLHEEEFVEAVADAGETI